MSIKKTKKGIKKTFPLKTFFIFSRSLLLLPSSPLHKVSDCKPFFKKESFTKEINFSFSTGFLFSKKKKCHFNSPINITSFVSILSRNTLSAVIRLHLLNLPTAKYLLSSVQCPYTLLHRTTSLLPMHLKLMLLSPFYYLFSHVYVFTSGFPSNRIQVFCYSCSP